MGFPMFFLFSSCFSMELISCLGYVSWPQCTAACSRSWILRSFHPQVGLMLSGRLLFFTSEYQDLGYREAIASPWWMLYIPSNGRQQCDFLDLPQAVAGEAPSHEVDRDSAMIWRYNLEVGWPTWQSLSRIPFLFLQALPEKQIRSELSDLHMTSRLYRKFIAINW